MNELRPATALMAVDYDPFASMASARVAPTTESQREIWLATQLGIEASLAYNESISLRLRGPLDETALRGAIQDLVDRHDSLRSTFSGDGQSLFVVDSLQITVARTDLSTRSPRDQAAAQVEALRRAVEQPFDLEQGPLLRCDLLAFSGHDHMLALTAHHIVCDGWSFGVLATELARRYAVRTGRNDVALESAPSFTAYALRQRGAEHSRLRDADTAFWVSIYDDGSIPALELPTDRARKPMRTFASRREDTTLEAELVQGLRKLGAARGASLFATLFGMFAALLARLSNSDEVVVGVPAAGQAADGSAGLVGHCLNLLPIRVGTPVEQDIASFLSAVSASVLDAYEHQHCTLGSLLKKLQIERDPARLSLVSVLFNLDAAIDAQALSEADLRLELESNPRHFENFELFLNASQSGGAVVLECQFNTDLFDAATIRRWLALYRAALQRAVADPALPLALALAPTPTDLQQLAAFNRTRADGPRDQRIEALIVRQCAASPDRIAVSVDGRRLSYRDLDIRSDRLAAELRTLDAGPGRRIGLCCGRNEHLLVALLGILKAGATYVPLDPNFPAERLEFMAADADLRIVVSDRSIGDGPRLGAIRNVLVDRLAGDAPLVAAQRSLNDVAYVIYTSGSTGQPKGVAVPHAAALNFLASMAREPGMSEGDRLLAVTTLSFDIAVLELLLPLSVGAEVVLASRDQAQDGQALRGLLDGSGVTVMQATPSTWRLLVEAGWSGSPGFKALVGGEPLPTDLAQSVLERCGELWNLYGPTETTVWSSLHRVEAVDGPVPIGRPIANTAIHVVDARLRPLPLGAVGELFIGGAGVTDGYLGQPDLSAERFVPDPFSAEPGARGYRTGDLGRWRSDGQLECLGRTDHQVKVRGYRIELGEIEAKLLTHPDLARALVVRREDRPGDVRLIAYVVPTPAATVDRTALQAHLRRTLPEYMLPQGVVVLAAIPLLPNGKIDRRALPAPDQSVLAGRERIAPRSERERAVASAMEAALSLPGLGVHDNFFALGGHSLLAAQLATALGQALGQRIPLRAVFDAPSIAQLAAWIEARAAPGAPAPAAIQARPESDLAPASLQQQRLWFLEQFDPGRLTYNTPSAHRLSGPLDVAALERSLSELVRRQAVLRTAIVAEDGVPMQRIGPAAGVSLQPVADLSALGSPEREARLLAMMGAGVARPIDLRQAPLFRVGLYKLAAEEHVLFFMPHHIIWDGWSFDLFYEEMATLYGAYSKGREPRLVPLAASYADYAHWQQQWLCGDDLKRQLSQWKQRLADPPEALQLPLDRPRPARMSGGGATEALTCSPELTQQARRFGQGQDATLFMTLLATYALLLCRLSGQCDIVIGTPVRGRDSAQTRKVMGFFVNALPLRLRIDPAEGFVGVLAQVRTEVLDAFAAPDVPFEHLVHELNVPRDESRSPIYQAFFSFQDARQRERRWGALQQEQVHLFQPGAAEDLGLWFLEDPHGLAGGLSYNTDVFTATTAQRLVERFHGLLANALADPHRPVGQLDYMTAGERALLELWNRTGAASSTAASVAEFLQAQVRRAPQRVAVRSSGLSFSYTELESRANRLARELRARGMTRGALVGLYLERSPEMLVALLAVLKSGAAYVPLDPSYPAERLATMAEDARLGLLVSHSSLAEASPWPRSAALWLDLDGVAIGAHPDTPLAPNHEHDPRATDPAYVIYTSGSTGRPKAVVVPHAAVLNFLTSMAREPGLSEPDRLLAVTTLSFDIAVLELLLPLSVGATVVLATRDEAQDGRALRALLDREGVTVMQATPNTWRMLIDAGWTGAPAFKALVGGEALPMALAQSLLERCGELWNLYGPTETTVWSTCWKVDSAAERICIGRPIANTQIHILDPRGQPCAVGVHGEICIGGAGVALGYLRRPELTAACFVADPTGPGKRVYRTGDLGRWGPDGLLEHLGRLDEQVKVRGHRIEPGEIEATLISHAQVAQALVMAREDTPGDLRLVAYVTPRGGQPSTSDLRQYLRLTLPHFMLPQHFVVIEQMPLTPNGKIDRKALPIPGAAVLATPTAVVQPLGPTEQAVAAIWQDMLGITEIQASDNFYDLGGHSLLAVRVVMAMDNQLGLRVDLRRLIYESLGQIAATPGSSAIRTTHSPVPPPRLVTRWLGRLVRRP